MITPAFITRSPEPLGWVNVSWNSIVGFYAFSELFKSREQADEVSKRTHEQVTRIACIEVHEGDGLTPEAV